MVFSVIKAPVLVQEKDKFRINLMLSYAAKGSDSITTLEVDPGDGTGFIDISSNRMNDWYFDYQYANAGTYTIQARIGNGTDTATETQDIVVVTEADDLLFSNDRDLVKHESEILNWLPDGKSSYKYMHRRSQELMLEWLYSNGYRKQGNLRLEKTDLINIQEVKEWSTFLTMSLIFQDNKKQNGDTLDMKAEMYIAKSQMARPLAIRADWNNDGTVSDFESTNINTVRLVRN